MHNLNAYNQMKLSMKKEKPLKETYIELQSSLPMFRYVYLGKQLKYFWSRCDNFHAVIYLAEIIEFLLLSHSPEYFHVFVKKP